MLSRLNMIVQYSRVSKLLPIKRYQTNFTVDNMNTVKAENDKKKKVPEEKVEECEDLDLLHDRCMLTKDAKIETVDIDGQQIEPIDINPWYAEDEMDRANEAAIKEAKLKQNPTTSTVDKVK